MAAVATKVGAADVSEVRGGRPCETVLEEARHDARMLFVHHAWFEYTTTTLPVARQQQFGGMTAQRIH